jgi:hypothetical protein
MAVSTIQAPERTTRPVDVSRQVGEAEETASPIAVAKADATKKHPAATREPPNMELHWKKDERGAATAAGGAGSIYAALDMLASSQKAEFAEALMQAEKR